MFPKSEKTRFLLTWAEREKKKKHEEKRVTMAQKPFEHLTCNLAVGLENHFNAPQLIVSNLINDLWEQIENNRKKRRENLNLSNQNYNKKNNYLLLLKRPESGK